MQHLKSILTILIVFIFFNLFFISPAFPGNLDGDSLDDVIVLEDGQLFVFLGSSNNNGELDLDSADYIIDVDTGSQVSFLPDEDGDGLDEILIVGAEEEVILSSDLDDFATETISKATTPRFARIGVGVGVGPVTVAVSESADCSFNPLASQASQTGLALFAGLYLLLAFAMRHLRTKE